MGKNLITKKFYYDSTWTCPAGVKSIEIYPSGALSGPIGINFFNDVYSWGSNAAGQLGDGTTANKSSPVLVIGGYKFVQMASSSFSTYGLTAFGDCYAWGANPDGQLGDGTVVSKSSPVAVIGGYKFVQITGNSYSAAYALGLDGYCYSWGGGTYGELGTGSTISKSSPIIITGQKFIRISGFEYGCYGLKSDGSCYAWGGNFSAKMLGDGTLIDKSSPVAVIGGYKFIQIAGGSSSGYGLTASGDCYAWGKNDLGQLGDGTLIDKSSPVAVIGGYKFIQIAGSGWSAYGLTASGDCYAWGHNNLGQLGDGTTVNKSSPVLVVGGYKFVQVSGSRALTASGDCYAWGNNIDGQLGDGTRLSKSSPVMVAASSFGKYKFATNPFSIGTSFNNKLTFSVTPNTTYSISFSTNGVSINGSNLFAGPISSITIIYGV